MNPAPPVTRMRIAPVFPLVPHHPGPQPARRTILADRSERAGKSAAIVAPSTTGSLAAGECREEVALVRAGADQDRAGPSRGPDGHRRPAVDRVLHRGA